jgi:thiosulfate dehydrogenase (quinone) large subunit
MTWPLRILRAFLGVTFLYAGIQKFMDPGFLHAGSQTYIGTQLRGFAVGTPAAPLMRLLDRAPTLVGIGVALIEIAVGLGVLVGIGLLSASTVGLSINVVLWLSATWHVRPYFIGSDSIYAVAWLALVAGIWELERRRSPLHAGSITRRIDSIDRRQFVRGGLIAGATLMVAAVSTALSPPQTSSADGASDLFGGTHGGPSSAAQRTSEPESPTASPAAGRKIATLAQLPIGRAVGFEAPGVGPAALVRLANGSVVAYSRVCTHAGCLVGYDAQEQLLVCPCHGAAFDPSQHAQPMPGSPTSTPLQMIRVIVDRSTGDVLLPS